MSTLEPSAANRALVDTAPHKDAAEYSAPSITAVGVTFDSSAKQPVVVHSIQHELSASASENFDDVHSFRIINNLNSGFPLQLSKLFSDEGNFENALTRQQKKIISDMYNRLRNGIDVVKHGRGGKAHQRFLYCDENLTTLFWRADVSCGL
jgi:hypothetical protein